MWRRLRRERTQLPHQALPLVTCAVGGAHGVSQTPQRLRLGLLGLLQLRQPPLRRHQQVTAVTMLLLLLLAAAR
jgi:hypothetical protein